MKLKAVLTKTFREQIRSGWDLILSISLAPLFIFLYWLFIGSASTTTFSLLVVNPGPEDCSRGLCAAQIIQRLETVQYATDIPILRVTLVTDETAGETLLRNRQAVAMITFPEGFSASLDRLKQGSLKDPLEIRLAGDLSHPYYPLVSVIATSVINQALDEIGGRVSTMTVIEKPLGFSGQRSEFDLYVPGLLIASIVMIIFSVSLHIAREVEAGTTRRLFLSNIRSFDYLVGVSLVYMIISLFSVILSFVLAVFLGFHFYGSPWLVLLICSLTALGSISFGLITACFSKTTARAAVIANIPLLLLLFLGGAIFPLPYPTLFTWAGHPFTFADILPTSHAVSALNKVLGLGAGWQDVCVELSMLSLLTVGFFGAGVRLFKKMQLN